MNVYVESNFVLELALAQEQCASCEEIMALCDGETARLVIPAYSLAEPYATLERRHEDRMRLKRELDREFGQLARTATYTHRLPEFQEVTALLAGSADDASLQLEAIRSRLLERAEVVPLDVDVLGLARKYRHTLSPKDSLVYASVFSHLQKAKSLRSCFLNRDLGFGDPDLVAELKGLGCKLLPTFDAGKGYLKSALSGSR